MDLIFCISKVGLRAVAELPAAQPVPLSALLPTAASAALGHGRVLPAPLHRDALLYILLHGGELVINYVKPQSGDDVFISFRNICRVALVDFG